MVGTMYTYLVFGNFINFVQILDCVALTLNTLGGQKRKKRLQAGLCECFME